LVTIEAGFKGIYGRGIKLSGKVFHEGKLERNVAGESQIIFTYNSKENKFYGVWPPPWNPKKGTYLVEVEAKFPDSRGALLNRTTFSIHGRKGYEFTKPFSVMTIETEMDMLYLPLQGPRGEEEDWRNFTRWADFLGAEGILYSAGWTIEGKVSPEVPWYKTNLRNLPHLAEASHNAGLTFGAWIGAYLLWGPWPNTLGYKHAWQYRKGRLFRDHHFSISDEKRKKDIIQLLRKLDSEGLEMVDEFVESMLIIIPHNWNTLGLYDKMRWLGKKIALPDTSEEPYEASTMRKKWKWWLAHKSSLVLSDIVKQARSPKPFFVFILGWDMGHDHGQDPVMFHDAGADLISVMLYESNLKQWKSILELWSEYLRGDEGLNLIVGEMIDASLIGEVEEGKRKTRTIPEPEIYTGRLMGALSSLDGPKSQICGLFWHDLIRGNWGKLKPYSKGEWLIAGAKALTSMNPDLSSDILITTRNVKVVVENQGKEAVRKGTITPFKIPESIYQVPETPVAIPEIPPGKIATAVFPIHTLPDSLILLLDYQDFQTDFGMVAFEIETEKNRIVDYSYVTGKIIENENTLTSASERKIFSTRSIFGGGDCLVIRGTNEDMNNKVITKLHQMDFDTYKSRSKKISLSILKKYRTLILLDTRILNSKSQTPNSSISPSFSLPEPYLDYLKSGGRILLHVESHTDSIDPSYLHSLSSRGIKVGMGKIIFVDLNKDINHVEECLNWLISS
jgi:hypothetical protein